ncbi:MAG: hypothetical protein WBL63_21315 [Candidatus Acidiferrum sp.]
MKEVIVTTAIHHRALPTTSITGNVERTLNDTLNGAGAEATVLEGKPFQGQRISTSSTL